MIVLDWYTKKVVGYKLKLRFKSEDCIDGLDMVLELNCPLGARKHNLNLMSDNDLQLTSCKYETNITLLGINHVTTSYSNPKGNSDTERFMRPFKEGIICPYEYDSFEEAQKGVDGFIKI